MEAAYQSSTASWPALARLRKQGQKPIAFVAVTDSGQRQAYWERLGFWALMLPADADCYLLSGLWVMLDCVRNPATIAKAEAVASVRPKRLQISWRGERFDTVIP